jgi:hypothetical protein
MAQVQGGYLESGASAYNSSAAEQTEQVKTSPGKLFALVVSNFNAAVRWVYVFDTNNGTTTGAPICPPIPLQASGAIGSCVQLEFNFALPFTTGLFVAASSTGPTYTASGANDLRMTAIYK